MKPIKNPFSSTKISRFACIVAALFFAASLVSCEARNDEPYFTLAPGPGSAIAFNAAGQTLSMTSFNVITNQPGWNATLSPADSWVTLTKSATGFSISASPNTSGQVPDPVTLTVTAGDSDPYVIQLTQSALLFDFLDLEAENQVRMAVGSTETVNYAIGGESKRVSISGNVPTGWTVTVDEEGHEIEVTAPNTPGTASVDLLVEGEGGSSMIVTLTLQAFAELRFEYEGEPVRIPLEGQGGDPQYTSTAKIEVTGLAGLTVAKVVFSIDGTGTGEDAGIEHTYTGDLIVTLISPDGTRCKMFSGIGSGTDDITNLTLDDEAETILDFYSTGTGAPMTGTFKPIESLSGFNGETPNGTWTLEIYDQYNSDTGYIRAWSVTITVE